MKSNVISSVPIFNVTNNELVENKATDIVETCEKLLQSPVIISCMLYNKVVFVGSMPVNKTVAYIESIKNTIEDSLPRSVKKASNILKEKGYIVMCECSPLSRDYYALNYIVVV